MYRFLKLLPLAALLAATSCTWLGGGMDAKCDEKAVRDYPAPGGKLKAIEYHTKCEAPALYHSTINVTDADGSAPATAIHVNPVTYSQPPVWPQLKVEWKSDKELWVTYPGPSSISCISAARGVAVHCVDGSIAR